MEVLLLEDDHSLRFAIEQVLEDENHAVLAAGDLPNALELITTKRFDLLLLDLMIHGELSTQIADVAALRLPDAEVIFITGSNQFPHAELFQMTQNTSWVLRKPIDFYEFKSMISHIAHTVSKRRSPSILSLEPLDASA